MCSSYQTAETTHSEEKDSSHKVAEHLQICMVVQRNEINQNNQLPQPGLGEGGQGDEERGGGERG